MTTQPSLTGGSALGFIPILKRWWWLLVLSAVITGVIAYTVSKSATPTYESRAELLVGPINADTDTIRAAGQLAQTYAELATNRPLLESTISDLGLAITPDELKADTTVTANADTRFLTIRVRNSNPELAGSIANTLADNLTELTSGGTTRPEGAVTVVDAAGSGSEVGANETLTIALAAAAGFVAVLLLILLIEYIRGVIHDEYELGDLGDAPVLGTIDVSGRPAAGRALTVEAYPGSQTAASYRLLAAEVEFSQGDEPPKSLLVTGVRSGEGAGELAANLAAALARGNRKVLLIDVDDRVGEVSTLLGPRRGKPAAGGQQSPPPAIKVKRFASTLTPTLEALPREALPGLETMDIKDVENLLAQLFESHEVIVVAGGPALESSTSLTWARATDGTVVSAMRDRTKRDDVGDAVESLRRLNANVIGTVLTQNRLLTRLGRNRGARVKTGQRPAWAPVGGGGHREPSAQARVEAGGAQNGPGAPAGTASRRRETRSGRRAR